MQTLLRKISGAFNILQPRVGDSRDRDTTRGMVLAIGVGVIAGLGAVLFRKLIAFFHAASFGLGDSAFSLLGDYYIILIPALGGLVVGPLIYFFAREAKGHGVPEVMIAMVESGGRIRPRVAMVKILASALCIGTGGSVGREGPIVQIGATFGSTIAQKLKLPEEWIRTLVACGAAGGISATFNAPIAGVFFALEIILGSFKSSYFSIIVVSSVVADAVSHVFFPDIANIIVPPYRLQSAFEFPLYAMLGLLAAFVGVLFIKVLYLTEDIFDRFPIKEYLKPVVGGLIIGCMGLFSKDLLGVGYGGLEKAAAGELGIMVVLLFLCMKILATSITIGSGGSGGVFAPSLFLGSMLGAAFGAGVNFFFPDITAPQGAYALVGMAAVFSASARAPITAILILFELTRNYSIILPLMLTVVVSTIVAQLISKETIYTKKMIRKGVNLPGETDGDILDSVKVSEVMSRDFKTVPISLPLKELNSVFRETGYRGICVVDEKGELFGLVTVSDLENALKDGKYEASAGDIASRSLVTSLPDTTIRATLLQLGAKEVGRIPVVSPRNEKELVGILRRHDIIRAYVRKGGNGEHA